MGVFLYLSIIPERIKAKDWKAVYNESLLLLENYPFLNRVEDSYCGIRRIYAQRSAHDPYSGSWDSYGDMRTGANTEWFGLRDDIETYQKRNRGYLTETDWDVLLESVEDCPVEHPEAVSVWANKTQGEDSHIYLLAIGCLICHRFPDAAHIWGDISAGQCRRAVRWANQFLPQPIDVPTTADMHRLLPRLLRAGIPEEELLRTFYSLTLQGKNRTMGTYLREMLPEQVFYRHYRKHLKPYERCEGQVYLQWRVLKEYLELGFDFQALCRMVMVDPEGNQLTPREFLRKLLGMKLHVEEKETYDYTKSPREWGDSEAVDHISAQFSRIFGLMSGASNVNVNTYIPLEQICADFREILENRCDAEALAKDILRELAESEKNESAQRMFYDDPESRFVKLAEEHQKLKEELAQYDITSYDDLMNFAEGKSVFPKLHESLKGNFEKLHTFGIQAMEELSPLGRVEREIWFLNRYQIMITKELQKLIFERIMDDTFIQRYAALYCVDCKSDKIYKLIRALLWNPVLLNYYWELTYERHA